ncbi:MAG: hypothetical protein H6767_06760 [Candidatus Peribacteria bacterium]|nr:MAG: hypothetical protein H6767_06760 [Candidatus Peribacteria bacterium]
MKKEYILLILIIIMLYVLFNIIQYKYREYTINTNIERIVALNHDIKTTIDRAQDTITYKSTKAYRNKVLKEQQGLKNRGEEVLYLTSESTYNRYVNNHILTEEEVPQTGVEKNSVTESMTNYERWVYFLFKKDIR